MGKESSTGTKLLSALRPIMALLPEVQEPEKRVKYKIVNLKYSTLHSKHVQSGPELSF